MRRYLSHLIDPHLADRIDPGNVFDLLLPLDDAAEGDGAMGSRHAIKTLPAAGRLTIPAA